MCGSTIIGFLTPLLINESLFHSVGTLTKSTWLLLIQFTHSGNNFSNSHTVLPIIIELEDFLYGAVSIIPCQISGVECIIQMTLRIYSALLRNNFSVLISFFYSSGLVKKSFRSRVLIVWLPPALEALNTWFDRHLVELSRHRVAPERLTQSPFTGIFMRSFVAQLHR